MISVLEGQKTYITAVGMLLYGIGGALAELHTWDTGMHLVFEAFAIAFLRKAIASQTEQPTQK